ncbi:MAG: hypothetical protein DI626_06450 [Micavibrio aeruginosavorus]|uniref:Fibronectin type III-like domain-containing protein n=1 Tax=Micavibrio aeruginosavorus TaxID=349221 RepID=A0A2W4ZW26_9BACT|nr:MAG: hypothetical protein DI626_06450 [Micavibrio aeruginosavorus]
MLEGMQAACGDDGSISYAKGANILNDPVLADRLNVHNRDNHSVTIDERSSGMMIAEALEKAHAADVIVAVIGEAKEHSGESSSRTSLDIPQEQRDMLRALRQTGKPVVAVVMTGRPLVLREEAGLADALLVSWFGGTEAGNALADVLYGRVNPSGKLPVTFPYNEGQIPVYHSHEPTGRPYSGKFNKFTNGYLDLPDDVAHKTGLFPFGHGLSYTTFSHEQPRVGFSRDKDRAIIKTNVTNNGSVAGQEVVQLYVTDLVASSSRPVRELKGFKKIMLQPGETKEIVFSLSRKDVSFSIANDITDTRRRWEEGEFLFATGTSSQSLQETKVYWRSATRQNHIEYKMS